MAAVVVVLSEVAIRGMASQEIVDRDEQGVSDGDHRLLMAPMAHDAPVARRQGPPAVADRTEGGLGERRAEPGIAPARLARAMLAGALVVARTERRPTGQMTGAGEN